MPVLGVLGLASADGAWLIALNLFNLLISFEICHKQMQHGHAKLQKQARCRVSLIQKLANGS